MPDHIPILTTEEVTADRLETISCDLVTKICNDKDFQNSAIEFLDEDFTAINEGNIIHPSRDHFLEAQRQIQLTLPNHLAEVINVTSDINEHKCTATVWMTVKSRGFINGVCIETVSQLSWRRKRAGWICYRHDGIDWCGITPRRHPEVHESTA
ncbi:hypothetical protein DOTSEDRAFT_68091 [Dothistroma septosporum NZE10]|uniref:SnoaL-like domain-containing protein n=1 Tax=Dothistroma septosporum (strain NZE10 / CBS 128990) TaxID=675120 RepID=N1Q0L9_DOTSN|nr:hypothetical protein DOTSEDRAFT_68091 [Dothistroma septosporum NZE10]